MTVFLESAIDDAITYTPLLDDVFVVTSSFIGKSIQLLLSVVVSFLVMSCCL